MSLLFSSGFFLRSTLFPSCFYLKGCHLVVSLVLQKYCLQKGGKYCPAATGEFRVVRKSRSAVSKVYERMTIFKITLY